MPDTRKIKILLIEDDSADVALISEILAAAEDDIQIGLERADRISSAIELLGQKDFDIIISDLTLPDSRGIDTFIDIHKHSPNLPIIVLTGLDDKEIALDAVRKGAQDFLVKGRFDNDLLVRAILYCIERQKLLNEIKTLRGIIPICAGCKKIRDDKGYWNQVEVYVSEHTDAEFTHGMCPECIEKTLAELKQLKDETD